jgi:molybdopterin synthase sulfur carrier subunit
MPTLTVRLFAQLREAKSEETVTVDVSAGTTLREVYEQMFDGPLRALPIAFARNHTYAKGSEVVEDGDDIAFLPPVGGG